MIDCSHGDAPEDNLTRPKPPLAPRASRTCATRSSSTSRPGARPIAARSGPSSAPRRSARPCSSTSPARRSSRSRSTASPWRSPTGTGTGCGFPSRSSPRRTRSSSAMRTPTRTRGAASTSSSTRGRRGVRLLRLRAVQRAPAVPVLRPAGPQGDLLGRGHGARVVAGRLERPRGLARPGERRPHAARLRATKPFQHLPHGRDRGPVRGLRGAGGRGPAAALVPPGRSRSTIDPSEVFDGHEAGLRLLPGVVRLPVSLRQIRPGVRARVQRGRHGERGRGHAPRAA